MSDVPEWDDVDEALGICQRGPDGIETVATGHTGFADAFAHFDRAVEINAVILPDLGGGRITDADKDEFEDGADDGGDGDGDGLRGTPWTPVR